VRIALLRPLVVAGLALAALALGACSSGGDAHARADNEGVYVNAGPIAYQVQISRLLNPAAVEDREFLAGLPFDQQQLPPDEEWFGVWVRLQNQTEATQPIPGRERYRIVDAQGAVYRPIDLPPENPFAYRAGGAVGSPSTAASTMDGNGLYPVVDSAAARTGPLAGAMLLFRLKTSVYQNRPLELELVDTAGRPAGSVTLDL